MNVGRLLRALRVYEDCGLTLHTVAVEGDHLVIGNQDMPEDARRAMLLLGWVEGDECWRYRLPGARPAA